MGAGETNGRWTGIERPYGHADIERIRGRFHVEHTLARLGAERLWQLLHSEELRRRARRADRRAGRADGQGRLEGDLPVRLAGRSGREPRGAHVPGPEPLSGEQRAGAREAHQQRVASRRPDRLRGGQERHLLARAHRRRRRGGLRRAAQRVRAHEGVHRGRRRWRPLRGSALVGEEVRPSRRQGARPDEPVRPHARLRAARRRCPRRPHRPRRAHRRPLRDPADQRRRRARPRVHHRRAYARGLLPHHAWHRGSDRAGSRLRAVRRRPLVRDLDAGPRRGSRSSPRPCTRGSPASCSPTTARRRSTGASTSTTRRSRRSSASWPRWVTGSSS